MRQEKYTSSTPPFFASHPRRLSLCSQHRCCRTLTVLGQPYPSIYLAVLRHAGVVVLEELEHARARGAPILAEFIGGSFTSDAYHLTDPRPDGAGVSRCIEQVPELWSRNPLVGLMRVVLLTLATART